MRFLYLPSPTLPSLFARHRSTRRSAGRGADTAEKTVDGKGVEGGGGVDLLSFWPIHQYCVYVYEVLRTLHHCRSFCAPGGNVHCVDENTHILPPPLSAQPPCASGCKFWFWLYLSMLTWGDAGDPDGAGVCLQMLGKQPVRREKPVCLPVSCHKLQTLLSLQRWSVTAW